MADKKVVLVIASSAEIVAGGEAMIKLLKKGVLLKNYSAGNVLDGVEETEFHRVAPAAVADELEGGAALSVVDLGHADTSALDQALALILEAADRRTALAVVGKNAMVLYGAGMDTKVGAVDRAVSAADIMPTLAAVGEFALCSCCTGAVIYQALKNPNPKLDEIRKLREGIQRMEGALARDNREPWDKHDCA